MCKKSWEKLWLICVGKWVCFILICGLVFVSWFGLIMFLLLVVKRFWILLLLLVWVCVFLFWLVIVLCLWWVFYLSIIGGLILKSVVVLMGVMLLVFLLKWIGFCLRLRDDLKRCRWLLCCRLSSELISVLSRFGVMLSFVFFVFCVCLFKEWIWILRIFLMSCWVSLFFSLLCWIVRKMCCELVCVFLFMIDYILVLVLRILKWFLLIVFLMFLI